MMAATYWFAETFADTALIMPGPSGLDQTSEMQAVIDGSAIGDTILWTPGTYLTTGLKLKPLRSYLGLGGQGFTTGTIIKQVDGNNGNYVLAAEGWQDNRTLADGSVVLRDLRIDGNKANNPSNTHGLLLMNRNSLIENVWVKECPQTGIKLTMKNRAGASISDTAVENKIRGCKIEECDQYGIFAEDTAGKVTDGWVTDCIVSGIAEHGIFVNRASGWHIAGNHLYDIGFSAIIVQTSWGTIVFGNYIEGYGVSATLGTYSGISASSGLSGDACVIMGNRIRVGTDVAGTTYRGVSLGAGTAQDALFAVTGNTIVLDGSGVPLVLALSSGGTLVAVADNNLASNHGTTVVSVGAGTTLRGGANNSWNYAAAVPAAGAWPAGMKVWHSAPAASTEPGWVCTAAGTPGTWKTMAALGA